MFTQPYSFSKSPLTNSDLILPEFICSLSDSTLKLPLFISSLEFNLLLDSDQKTFIDLVSTEISRRYPETGEKYSTDLLAAVSGNMKNFGLLSTAKSIIACYKDSHLLGFTVATEKINQTVKFGPTIVLPSLRGQCIGVLLRKVAENIYEDKGYTKAYSTCQSNNIPARRYVEKAGYKVEAVLRGQYVQGSTELVFSKYLTPKFVKASRTYASISQSRESENRLFSFSHKRGGAVKIHVDFDSLVTSSAYSKLEDVLEEVLSIISVRYARRIYLHAPLARTHFTALNKLGFTPESRLIASPTMQVSEVIFGRNRS
jgi:GNAT superfamily N-acetyltransferase